MSGKMYYIGKVEEICKISKKTLRYYDKLGVLSPDKVIDENGYRYYSENNLLSIPVIKYYKQSGFKLEEIKGLIDDTEYEGLNNHFVDKVQELEKIERELNLKIKSIKDWHSLIKEAKMVIENDILDVSIKYLDKVKMIFLNQEFNYDYRESIINIEFTNYIESIENAITGPVIMQFQSYKDKMQGNCKEVKIIQKNILKCDEDKTIEFGGHMVASCYHIGDHKDIDKTYEKIKKWVEEHNYSCEDICYERYIVDYWTSKKVENFVTEILVKVKK